jgi:hypothetical protein
MSAYLYPAKAVTVETYLDEYGLDSIFDLDILETRGDCDRYALPDGENSIWVCGDCGELCDPDDREAHEEDCCELIPEAY